MQTKTCTKCKIEKPLSEYHKSSSKYALDGHFYYCKVCKSSVSSVEYKKNREGYFRRAKKFRSTEKGKELAKKNYYDTKKNRPVIYAARVALNNAVQNGTLKRLPCEACGALKTDGHHPDYSRPLEVNWLCRLHHMEIHKI